MIAFIVILLIITQTTHKVRQIHSKTSLCQCLFRFGRLIAVWFFLSHHAHLILLALLIWIDGNQAFEFLLFTLLCVCVFLLLLLFSFACVKIWLMASEIEWAMMRLCHHAGWKQRVWMDFLNVWITIAKCEYVCFTMMRW